MTSCRLHFFLFIITVALLYRRVNTLNNPTRYVLVATRQQRVLTAALIHKQGRTTGT